MSDFNVGDKVTIKKEHRKIVSEMLEKVDVARTGFREATINLHIAEQTFWKHVRSLYPEVLVHNCKHDSIENCLEIVTLNERK